MNDLASDIATSNQASPSRCDNPFATCWVRPGALAFQFPPEVRVERLVANLAAHKWRGAIVGPHGSGKTTLLETLKPVLVAAGCRIRAISLHNGQRRLPSGVLASACGGEAQSVVMVGTTSDSPPGQLLIVVDGYEQLGWFARALLNRFCRRTGAGLLVTAHALCGIPALIHLAPVLPLVEQLVSQLSAKVSTQITKSHVAASHACHGSNVREIFFALYDQHEQLCRAT